MRIIRWVGLAALLFARAEPAAAQTAYSFDAGHSSLEINVYKEGFFKAFGPNTFEVNRVSQNQSRCAIKAAGREDVLDFVFSLFRNPPIDLASGCFRSGFEIHLVDVGLVFAFGNVQKTGQKRMPVLCPERISEVQFDTALFAGFAEFALEVAEGGMELFLILVEVKDSGHLLLGFATRAEKFVTFPLTLRLSGGELIAQGEVFLLQTDYGIKPVKVGGGAVKVKDRLRIHFEIHARASTRP